MKSFDVVRIDAPETVELRRVVLRDGRSDLSSTHDADTLESTVHLGVFEQRGEGDRRLIACLTLIDEPLDRSREQAGSSAPVRLIRMAVAADQQGSGVGGQMILAVQQLCGENGVWAAARVGALGFYERYGFRVVSDEYVGVMGIAHRDVVWP